MDHPDTPCDSCVSSTKSSTDELSKEVSTELTEGTPLFLWCFRCYATHIDRGEWATRPHKTHKCEECGHEWRPYEFPTVGVEWPDPSR